MTLLALSFVCIPHAERPARTAKPPQTSSQALNQNTPRDSRPPTHPPPHHAADTVQASVVRGVGDPARPVLYQAPRTGPAGELPERRSAILLPTYTYKKTNIFYYYLL